MAVAAWDLVTFAQVKAYLNIGVSSADTAQDVWLQEILSDVSRGIELYCKRKFASQDVSNEIYDGNDAKYFSRDHRRLYTRYWPIVQLSTETSPTDAQKLAAVQDRTDPDSSWTDIETDVDHILIDSENWSFMELYDDIFVPGIRNIRVSYKAGYTTVPSDLKNVCLEMVSMIWKESNRSGMGLLGETSKSSSGLGITVTKSLQNLDSKWKLVLDRYRVPTV